MKEFLGKIKLLDHLTTEVPIGRGLFIQRFNQQVDPGSTSVFSDISDLLSSSNNEYKGQVSQYGFKIKRKRRFFDMNMSIAIATGSFQDKDDSLIIKTEINGFRSIMLPFFAFILVFYIIFIVSFFGGSNEVVGIAIPFIILHASFMFGIPYFMMRRSTSRLKRDLEREFFYMTKSPSASP